MTRAISNCRRTSLRTPTNQAPRARRSCDAGVDRTGELYGDYQMWFGNQTYSQVYAYDNAIEPRKINTVNKQA